MKNKVINAGLYIRVSTEHQAKEGYSVSAQKANLSKFAKGQNWNIFDIYADEGISGKNIENRPEVKRLISDIRNKKIDVVVLYKFDRLTRDSKDTEDIIDLIQECGIQVFTLSGGIIDVSTATGRFSVRINGAVAQLEREQTIERIKVAFEEKVKQGYTLACATTCYGYDRKKHEKEQTVNIYEANVVKRIFNMYVNGKSFGEICDVLNSEKIPTKKNGKKVKKRGTEDYYIINSIWTPKTIRNILTNQTYIGKVRYHIGKDDGFVIEGRHKAIIEKALWNKAQQKLLKIKHISRTNLPREDVYFCGTLFCGECGHKLTTNRTIRYKKNGSKIIYSGYRCTNREKKLCSSIGISHKKVENAFLNFLDKVSDLTEEINFEIKSGIENELDKVKKSYNKLLSKKNEITDLYLIDIISNEEFIYLIKKFDKKIDFLKNEIEILKSRKSKEKNSNVKISKNIKEHWEYLSNKERLEFLTLFVEKIVIINRDKNSVSETPKIISVKFFNY